MPVVKKTNQAATATTNATKPGLKTANKQEPLKENQKSKTITVNNKKNTEVAKKDDKMVKNSEQSNVEETNDKKKSPKRVIHKFKFEGTADEVKEEIKSIIKEWDDEQKEFSKKLTTYRHVLTDLGEKYVKLRENEEKEKKKKEERKSKPRNSPEYLITDELCEFMGLEPGSKTSRTAALAAVSTYATEQGLNGIEIEVDVTDLKTKKTSKKIKTDKRYINLDKKLGKIFPNLVGVTDPKQMLQFTSIIRELNQHFPPKKEQKVDDEESHNDEESEQ